MRSSGRTGRSPGRLARGPALVQGALADSGCTPRADTRAFQTLNRLHHFTGRHRNADRSPLAAMLVVSWTARRAASAWARCSPPAAAICPSGSKKSKQRTTRWNHAARRLSGGVVTGCGMISGFRRMRMAGGVGRRQATGLSTLAAMTAAIMAAPAIPAEISPQNAQRSPSRKVASGLSAYNSGERSCTSASRRGTL
jgi:hypothetical protein